MKAQKYSVNITGETPLLLHHDNLRWAETMKDWAAHPANKSVSVAGDDRCPAWRWIGCLYHEAGLLVIPSDNPMTVLREGGKRCPTGKGQQTFKAQTQSGIVVDQSAWPLMVRGKAVAFPQFLALAEDEEKDFAKHEAMCLDNGFELFVKRAKIGANKHIRVRPRFDKWGCSGSVTVFDEMITQDVLQNILTFAGAYAGIGDWRPSSPKNPGPFGKFTATVEKI